MNGNHTTGPVTGTATQSRESMQVNPVDCARFALGFLARASFTAGERQAFDMAEGLLQAIVAGQVQIAQAPARPLTPGDDSQVKNANESAEAKRRRRRMNGANGSGVAATQSPPQGDLIDTPR